MVWDVVLEKTLESPLDCKAIQLVNPKGNQSWMFIERTDAEAEAPILWPPDAKNLLIKKTLMLGTIEGRGRGIQDEVFGWYHPLEGHEFQQSSGVGDGQGWLACCSSWGHKELDWATELNWTQANYLASFLTLDPLWDPPLGCTCTPQPWWISNWRLLGEARLIMVWCYPLTFNPQRVFLCMCSVSLVPEEGGSRSLIVHSNKVFPSVPLPRLDHCHDYYLKVYTTDKHCLLYPVSVVTSILEGKQKADCNVLTGAHLSLVSENANSFKYPAWSPLLCTPRNVNRRPVVNV